MVKIRAMEQKDTLQAAAIHIEGQPRTFLSSLGPEFVAMLFAYTIRSPHGFGFVAVEGEEVIGFVVGTTSTVKLFRHVLPRGFLPLSLVLLRHVLRRPGITLKLVETLHYPRAVREQPYEAESLTRGVRSDWQGKGVGSLLWRAVTDEARRRGATHLIMTVDDAHAVNAWHRARNHELVRTFTLYGRLMNVYRVALEAEAGRSSGDISQQSFPHEGDVSR